MKKILISILIIFVISCSTLYAVDVGETDIHGFISQGYIKSTENNFFADTKDGTFQFNEMGINFATWATPKLSLGIQFFASDIGDIGNDEITIDWAYADYRFKPFLGVRAGKIKTPIGLYNETRDIDSLRTCIFLPSSFYLETARETMVAIKGLGVYGELPFYFSYQFLIGTQEIEMDSGLGIMLQQFVPFFVEIKSFEVDSKHAGALLFERSNLKLQISYDYTHISSFADVTIGADVTESESNINVLMMQFASEYTFNDLVLSFEYGQHRNEKDTVIYKEVGYVGGSNRFTDWLELGFYYSWLFTRKDNKSGKGYDLDYGAWLKDTCVSARFDLNMNWTAKLEGHYFDGIAALLDYHNPEYERFWYMFAMKLSYLF